MIQHPKHPKVLLLHIMMEVVIDWRSHPRQTITRMVDHRPCDCQHPPDPVSDDVGAHDHRAEDDRGEVGDYVLEGVGVDGCHGHGGDELVVLFVDAFVDPWVVHELVGVEEG